MSARIRPFLSRIQHLLGKTNATADGTIIKMTCGIFLLLGLVTDSSALAEPPPMQDKHAPTDQYGDPLPDGAIARLGTVRFRHSDALYDLLVSPDGRTLISAGGNSVEIWDAQSGRRLRRFPFARNSVNGIELTPDGKLLVILQQPLQKMRFWDPAVGAEVYPFGDSPPQSMRAALSPNGELLATLDGPRSPTVSIWDMRQGKKIRTIENVENRPSRQRNLAFSPDGNLLVFPHASGFCVWDLAAGKKLYQLDLGAKVSPGCSTFSSDSKLLAAATYPVPLNPDHTIHLWDMATGKEMGALKGHESYVSALAVAPKGNVLASASRDGTIRFWDLAAMREISHHTSSSTTHALAFYRDGRTLVSGYTNGTIHRWIVDKGRDDRTPPEQTNTPDWIAFAPNGRTLITTGEGKIGLWEPLTGKSRRFVDAQLPYSLQKALSPDGKLLALRESLQGQQILLWDIATGKLVRRFGEGGPRGSVYFCRFAPDGRRLAAGSFQEDIVRIWDTASGKELMSLKGQTKPGSLAFSPDGKTLATASVQIRGDYTVRLWDLATGKEIWRQSTRPWAAMDMTFAPDGRTFALGGGMQGRSNQPGEVHLWDAATGKELRRLEGHRDQVRSVVFSADGRMLATGSLDETIRLWEVTTGGERRRFQNQKQSITEISFSPDGRLLASAGWGDSSALVWDLTGRFHDGHFQTRRLSTEELNRCWDDLAHADAARAYRSILALTGSPSAVTFLKDHLAPVIAADPKRVAPLLAALDSDQFAQRDKAMTELEKLGLAAEPALHAALDAKPSLEVRQRIEAILDKLSGSPRWRLLRALEVLEHIGTPEARQVLATLSKGTAEMWPTQEAKKTLARLSARSVVQP
jgi:WD40 repeat protein